MDFFSSHLSQTNPGTEFFWGTWKRRLSTAWPGGLKAMLTYSPSLRCKLRWIEYVWYEHTSGRWQCNQFWTSRNWRLWFIILRFHFCQISPQAPSFIETFSSVKVLLNYLPEIREPIRKFLVSLRDWPVSKQWFALMLHWSLSFVGANGLQLTTAHFIQEESWRAARTPPTVLENSGRVGRM